MMKTLGMVAGLAVAGAAVAPVGQSFQEVRDRVYGQPLSEPVEIGFSAFPEATILAAVLTGEVFARFAHVFEPGGNFQEAHRKPVHRGGVCAQGMWTITERSPLTGLLAKGTRVPAMVRFAVGTNRTVGGAGLPRTFGMAVKLFPSSDPAAPVVSRNVFFFDQFGIDGDKRAHFLSPDAGGPPIHFSNVVTANEASSKATNKLLGLFNKDPTRQQLFPITEVDSQGQKVAVPFTPLEIHAVVHVAPKDGLDVDYRKEIASYGDGDVVFDLVLPAELDRPSLTLGTLVLGQAVMSRVCDEELVFPHDPTR